MWASLQGNVFVINQRLRYSGAPLNRRTCEGASQMTADCIRTACIAKEAALCCAWQINNDNKMLCFTISYLRTWKCSLNDLSEQFK